jgi:glycosyltransferase involved in cell wall biosynthesis
VVADSLDGGIGAAVISHCTLFAGHGWQVTLAAPAAPNHQAPGVETRHLAVPDGARQVGSMASAARATRRLVQELRPDVVHAHGLRSLAVVLAGGRRPFVTLHSSDRAPGPISKVAWVREKFRDVTPFLVPAAFSVVPLSRGRWTTTLILSPRLPVLRGVVAEDVSSEPLFVFVSRLAPPKRPELFVDAMAAVAEAVPGARGVILGEGPGRAALEQQIRETGAPVRLMGQVDDMTSWYAQAWGVCLFSDSEGLPFVVQEAMWAGRPVVTSPLRGISWFAGDSVRYVTDPASIVDALVELCDPETRRTRGRLARERAGAMSGDDGVYRILLSAYGRTGSLMEQR